MSWAEDNKRREETARKLTEILGVRVTGHQERLGINRYSISEDAAQELIRRHQETP